MAQGMARGMPLALDASNKSHLNVATYKYQAH